MVVKTSLRLRAPVANHAVRGTAARHYFSACTVLPDRVEVSRPKL